MNLPFLKQSQSLNERHIRPNRDWSYIFAVCLVLAVVGVVWNVFIFSRLTRGQSISGNEEASALAASIAEIHAAFEKRGEEAKKYREEYQFVDPSRSGG